MTHLGPPASEPSNPSHSMQDEFLLLWGAGRGRGDLCKLSHADQLTGTFLAQLRPCGVGTPPAWRPGGSKKRARAHWTRACFPALLRLAFRGQKPQGGEGEQPEMRACTSFPNLTFPNLTSPLTPLSGNFQGWPFQLSFPGSWPASCCPHQPGSEIDVRKNNRNPDLHCFKGEIAHWMIFQETCIFFLIFTHRIWKILKAEIICNFLVTRRGPELT